jgi:hypothetical protein
MGVAGKLEIDGGEMKRSHCTQIHALLKTGPITAMHIFRLAGSMRGAARIHELRARGVAIETRMVQKGSARVAEYRLAGWEASYVE